MSTKITVKAKSKEKYLRLSDIVSSGETAFVTMDDNLLLIGKCAIFSASTGYCWSEPNACFTVKYFCDINITAEGK